MKVTAFVGSAHKKNTHQVVEQYLNTLQAMGDVETEIVTLSEYKLGTCRGCRICFEKGEELCPLKDDRDVLFQKIAESDGVIFASPNYSWQMSGMMKVFLDRFGFMCHRPRYFGKAFTSIVTQGFTGGNKIVEYFDFLANFLGFKKLKGINVTTLDPRTEIAQRKIDRIVMAHTKKFHAILSQKNFPVPSLFMLIAFRMARTAMFQSLDDKSQDFRYYAEKGWFGSDYFYPVHLGFVKNIIGKLSDKMTPMIQNMISLE